MDQGLQLSEEVTRRLLEEIRFGRYQDMKKLPPEVELAGQLGVSRTLLRDCLAILEREGFISRKHGVGTVINKHVLDVETRMDLEKEFLDMVKDAGYQAEIASVKVEIMDCDRETADKLKLGPGEPIFRVDRLITADRRPAIYCVDHIGLRHVKTGFYEMAELKKPIFLVFGAVLQGDGLHGSDRGPCRGRGQQAGSRVQYRGRYAAAAHGRGWI